MMKTLLITALAAASTACAVTLDSAAYTSSDTTQGSIALTSGSTISGSFSYTLTLNANAVKDFMNVTSTATHSIAVAVSNQTDHNISVALGAHVSPNDKSGIYGYNVNTATLVTGTDSAQLYTYNQSNSNGETSSTNPGIYSFASSDTVVMDDLTGISVTLSHTDTKDTSIFLTLQFSDGSVLEQYGYQSGVKWSGGAGSFNTLLFDSAYVTEAYVFSTNLTKEEAFGLNREALGLAVPEPTTATLSLLALAGLAARRRRK